MEDLFYRFYDFVDCGIISVEYELFDSNKNKHIETFKLVCSVLDREIRSGKKVILTLTLKDITFLRMENLGVGSFGYVGGAAMLKEERGYLIDFDPIDSFDVENDIEKFDVNDNSTFFIRCSDYEYSVKI